jgi:hypothetical protein
MRTMSSAGGGVSGTSLIELSAELRVRAGGRVAERANPLGDRIDRVPELGVLLHEHQVQRVEHRPGHVPVEVMGRQVERVGVGEQLREAAGDGGTVGLVDADVDAGSRLRHGVLSKDESE